MGLPSVSRVVPSSIVAGDTIEFLVAIPTGYSTWTGKARLTGVQTMDATTCATEGSDLHPYFQGKNPNGTASLAAGQYMLSVWASNGNDRRTLLQAPFSIQVDLSLATAPIESHAVEMLDVIERAIKARLTGTADGGIEAYAIDGRSVTKLPLSELYRLRARYQSEVSQEQNNNLIGSVKFSFPPSFPSDGSWPLGDPRKWYR